MDHLATAILISHLLLVCILTLSLETDLNKTKDQRSSVSTKKKNGQAIQDEDHYKGSLAMRSLMGRCLSD